jgi:uncharacterized protein (TIGR02270 family)
LTEAPHIPLIVELHAEEAAILWLQRDRAVEAPHYNRRFLARLDERLEANLDGLRVAGRAGWEIARAAFDRAPEPGEAFTLAALAFGAGSARGIGEVLDIVAADDGGGLLRAAISALGWLDAADVRGRVGPLLDDPRPQVRALGLGACAAHRADPADRLAAFLDDVPQVRARALRLAGWLGRTDFLPRLAAAAGDNPDCRFAAAWSAVRLGERVRAPEALRRIALLPGPNRLAALDLCAAAMPPASVREWLGTAGAEAEALAVRAAGPMGEPDLVPWLIDRMGDPVLGRRAGESFSLITGADLAFLDLDGEAPRGAPGGPSDDPADPDVALDPEADLPWPDPALVSEWWRQNRPRLALGVRHFLGQPRTEASLAAGLDRGYQPQRRAAALALGCLAPGRPLATWRHRERSAAIAR